MNKKSILWIFALLLFACTQKKSDDTTSSHSDSIQAITTEEAPKVNAREYSNERFRQVTLEKLDGNKFRIQGEAQVFEATFNWVVEDGHNELKSGFVTADIGAPEWGNFDFTIDVAKNDVNTTLILILFEISAKDGSHNYELPITLK